MFSGNSVRSMINRFTGGVQSSVNNDKGTSFWFSKWLGIQNIAEAFLKKIVLANKVG